MCPAAHPGPPASPRRRRASPAYALARACFQVAVRVYFRRVEVRNAERLPRSGPVLIVANHPAGMTDAVVLATKLKRPVHFLAMRDRKSVV